MEQLDNRMAGTALADFHGHYLPGIDDGSDSMETTMEMLGRIYDQGVRTVIATPHFVAGEMENFSEKILPLFCKVKECAACKFPDLKLHVGQEIYYFDGAADYLAAKKILTLAGTRYVLVEFSPGVTYKELYNGLQRLVHARYCPVLAHLERYGCLMEKEGRLEEVRDMGVWLQMNASSLGSGFSLNRRIMQCRNLVKKGLIQLVATDTHDMKYRRPEIAQAYDWVQKKCSEEICEEIFYSNPISLLQNELL